MDVLIQETLRYTRDIRKLENQDRARVEKAIDAFAKARATGTGISTARKLKFQMGRSEGALYSLRAGRKLRVLLAADEDPIFGQVVITALRAVPHDDLGLAVTGLAEVLFESSQVIGSDPAEQSNDAD